MSRRYFLTHEPGEIAARLGLEEPQFFWPVRDEIAPLQTGPVITADEDGTLQWARLRWGLVPAQTPDEASAQVAAERLIAARAESVAQKPAFAHSFSHQRCVVPASGWFAWALQDSERVRLRVQSRDGAPLFLAGIWDEWVDERGLVLATFSLISVEANRLLAPLGARMPAVLRPDDVRLWLNTDASQSELLHLLRPLPSRELSLHSRRGEALSSEMRDALLKSSEAERRARRVFPTRRVLKRDEEGGGKVFFSTRSWTTQDARKWHPVVDTHDGGVWCDCPDFRYRHAHHDPTLSTPQFWCKHVARAVRNCARHGELSLLSAA